MKTFSTSVRDRDITGGARRARSAGDFVERIPELCVLLVQSFAHGARFEHHRAVCGRIYGHLKEANSKGSPSRRRRRQLSGADRSTRRSGDSGDPR